MKMDKKASSYARVSSRRQEEDGTSLFTQQSANHALAERLGFVIPPEFDWLERASGADNSRPMFLEQQHVVTRRLVSAVFVYSSDRLARDPLVLLQFLRLCNASGVALHFADGTPVGTAEDEALTYLRGYFGYREQAQTAERTMRGKIYVARSGRMLCGYSRGIFGYHYDPTTKTLTVIPEEAAVVELIFTLRLDGQSVSRIARRLNDLGITTKHGHQWEARQVDSILRNEVRAGFQYYGKARYQTINGKRVVTPRPREEWILVPDFAPPIVEPDVFNAVQSMWNRPVSQARPKHRDYLFTGYSECALCGNSMGGASKLNNETRLYCYYRCSGTTPNAKRDAVCNAPQVPAIALEETVWSHIVAAVRDPSAIIADLRKHWRTGSGRIGQRVARLRRDIQKLRTEQMNLVRQHARGVIDQQMLDDLVAPLVLVREKHEKELGVLEEQSRLQDAADEAEHRIRVALAQYAEQLEDVTWEAKRALLNRLKVKVVATKERVLVTAEIDPSAFTIERTLASISNDSYAVVIVELRAIRERHQGFLQVSWQPC